MAALRLGHAQADALREVGNIGAAHAATALSEILHQPVQMQVPWVELVDYDHVTDVLGGPEALVACVYLRVTGDVSGSMFLMQSISAAKLLVRQVLPDEPESGEFSDLAISALGELGNIMAATYLTSLIDFTQLSMHPSVPMVAVDMAQAVLTVGLVNDDPGNCALVIHTTIEHLGAQDKAHFFLLPDPGAETTLLRALHVESAS